MAEFAGGQRRLLAKITNSRHKATVRKRTGATNVVRKWSARRRVAAVGVQHLRRHVARILAGEEQEARRDLVGLAGPPHRRVLAELGNLVWVRPAERIERSPDRPRSHR